MEKEKKMEFFTQSILNAIQPATGCTEPVAIALNAATARENVKGEIISVKVKMDICLLKNAMGVGIPGIEERGVKMCIAIGITGGKSELGMNVLSDILEEDYLKAKDLLPIIEVSIEKEARELYIETIITTNCGEVRVITLGSHDNIIDISTGSFEKFNFSNVKERENLITRYDLVDFIEYANNVFIDELQFLKEGMKMNTEISEKGRSLLAGMCLEKLNHQRIFDDNVIHKTQKRTMMASYARMSGADLPVMTTTGSGNQGIALFLTVTTVAEEFNIEEEKCLRALALAHLVNLYAKAYMGTLSALCACSIASSLSASVGIIYMLGGNVKQMIGCMKNIIGSITGMLCDGAKEGCANKVAVSTGVGVMSAFMAMDNFCINEKDGILGDSMKDLFTSINYIIDRGMDKTNECIVEIMLNKGEV